MNQNLCQHKLYSERTGLCLDCGAKIAEPKLDYVPLEALADDRNYKYYLWRKAVEEESEARLEIIRRLTNKCEELMK